MQVYNDFTLVARDATIDASDKMMSIFKILDEFRFTLSPANYKSIKEASKSNITVLPFNYVFASSWRLDKPVKEDFYATIRLRITDPNGKELGSSDNEVTFSTGNSRVRVSGASEHLPYTVDGLYTAEMTFMAKGADKELCKGQTTYEVKVIEQKIVK